MTAPARERGAALLAVLLLVAVMAAISVVALEKLRLATSLATNAAALDQARAYAFGAEALAMTKVGLLDGRQTGTTTLAGGWNGRVTRLPIPGGIAALRVRDGGNCFNLNSLAEGISASQLTARPAGIAQFLSLMRLLGIADPDARRVAAGLADWLDTDSTAIPDGAEDSDYLRAQKPYRAGNTLLSEVSELRAVSGVTSDIYRILRPWVCALPTTDMSPLNVNTLLPDQSVLLAMLLPYRMDAARAAQVLVQRPPLGWNSIAEFWDQPGLAGVPPEADVRSQPQLRTRWFALDLDVELGGAQVTETALIDGGLTPAKLVVRRWGIDE
ncbi:type II secretion system minor pseudopilin GspK [Sphingomonas profundi]|uniref:type II secretion system minor pseudopilin GspK n=1 Tax=Alterirhizorhabdus profundi TaxID=2681549 RepID=UPI001E5B2A96|nr:type II secretion system minor pseudopilin GspK [Sphingomonas profundi]